MKKLRDNGLICLFRAFMFSALPLFGGAMLEDVGQLKAGLYYAAGQLLSLALSFVPASRRVLCTAGALAAYVAVGAWLLGGDVFHWLLIAICAGLFLLTLYCYGTNTGYDTRFMLAGVVAHVIMPLGIQLSELEVDYTAMMWCGMIYLLMLPLVLNAASVREGMALRSRGAKPLARLTAKNRKLVIGLTALALFIACFDKLRDAAQTVGSWIWYVVLMIIEFLMSLYPGGSTGGQGGGGMGEMGLGGDAAEPSWFAKLLEQIFMYLAFAALAVIVVLLLWKVAKLLKRLVLRVSGWLKRYAESVKYDYVEESEQLVDWGEVGSEVIQSLREGFKRLTTREKRWSELDARQRVRYSVRQLYRKNGVAVDGIQFMSARQALDEMGVDAERRERLGELYDRARYSDHDVTESDAEQARSDAR